MESIARKAGSRQAVADRELGVVVGIDISKRWVDYGVYGHGWREGVRRAVQDAAGFAQVEATLERLKEAGHEVWVGLEPTGPYGACLEEWLRERGWRVVQVNPYHVKRTKEVRDNSPGKSDRKDAGVIADLVWQGCYQQPVRLEGVYAQLRAASAEWVSLGRKRTAAGNEFQALLQVWFPELVSIFRERTCQTVRGIVRRYRGVEAMVRAGRGSLGRTVKRASRGSACRRVEAIWQAAKTSVALTTGQEARRRAMLGLLDLLEVIERRQQELKGEMGQWLWQLEEGECLRSVPGCGVVTVAGLIGECGDLADYRSHAALEKFVGLNLYEVSSGQHRGRCRVSKRGRARARYLLGHMALLQMREGGLWHEWAQSLKAKGKRTGEIRVAVARKLLALLYAMARDRAVYDAARFLTGVGTADGPVIQEGAPAKLAA